VRRSAEEALEVAERVGYPIMIKASEGGGGKGVRKANEKSQIPIMYQQVADEVKGSPIFLMRLCNGARHVEIQVMADKHRTPRSGGNHPLRPIPRAARRCVVLVCIAENVAILSGRDCSMQRRFQKIVEEGPPISVGPETMRSMELAAAKLALMVDYTHAGTVEYLFIEETGEFYFLELNPRLQVEHPVSEGITGVNIPSLQLMVSMGVDLTKIDGTMDTPFKPVSPYIVDVKNPSTVNPFSKTDGHVVAVRITAENGTDGWKPTVGAIKQIDFQSLPGVWGYFSVRTPNAEVHAYADSQFGHVFAHAPTRKQAA
jgi:acetyl-CoA carboxylase/biotin carboxylase 1